MHLKIAQVIFHAVTVVITLAVLLSTLPNVSGAHSVHTTEIDLSNHPFEAHSKAPLLGEWWFHFGQRLQPQEAAKAAAANELSKIHVPSDWQETIPHDDANPHAHWYGTYVLKLTLPYSRSTPLAISFPRIADAYEVFWVPAVDLSAAARIGGSGAMEGPISAAHHSQDF
ncbi:MAG: hypothetical protein VX228_08970, partial [Pseudomonadota bacterium]|nr:hypothetical protein [Pseudomonadota bacterium]